MTALNANQNMAVRIHLPLFLEWGVLGEKASIKMTIPIKKKISAKINLNPNAQGLRIPEIILGFFRYVSMNWHYTIHHIIICTCYIL